MTKIETVNYVAKNKNGYLNDLKHKIGEVINSIWEL